MLNTTSAREDRLEILLDLVRDLSNADSGEQAVWETFRHYSRMAPVHLFVGVRTRGLDAGLFQVLYTIRAEELDTPEHEGALDNLAHVSSRHPLPIHSGGFIGDAVRAGEPRLWQHLDLRRETIFDGALREMRSARAVPIYDRGEISLWALGFSRDPLGFDYRDLEMSLLQANTLGAVRRNLDQLREITGLHTRMQRQLEDIARLQHALLPERAPEIPGASVATSYLTSDQSGGDYYDFFPLANERWGVLIADVSGHGAGAATIMAMLHAVLHAHPDLSTGPADVMRYANQRLVAAKMEPNFVTAFFGIYDPATRLLRYSRAGHPPPRLKDCRSGEVVSIDQAASVPLGVLEDNEPQEASLVIEPEQTLVLYTDGITESFNAEGRMFGTEGLDAALETCTGEPDCVVGSVHKALYEHTRSRTRADDQTLVVMKVRG